MHKLIMAIYLAFAVLAGQALASESIIEARHPLDGSIYSQQNHETCVRFYWRFNNGGPRKIRLEVSPSRKFSEIIKKELLVEPPYFWCHHAVGRFYWRLVLLDDDQQPQEITPVRYFTISPQQGLALQTPHQDDQLDLANHQPIHFSWNLVGFDKNPQFFRLKVASDRSFSHPVINQEVESSDVTVTSLKNGTYYWKVGVKYTPFIPLQYSQVIVFKITGSPETPQSEIPVAIAIHQGLTPPSAKSTPAVTMQKSLPVPSVTAQKSLAARIAPGSPSAQKADVKNTKVESPSSPPIVSRSQGQKAPRNKDELTATKRSAIAGRDAKLPAPFTAIDPRDGHLFKQKDGKSCLNFSFQLAKESSNGVLLQISPSRRFKQIIKKETLAKPPFVWCTKEVGRQYWRFSLLDEQKRPQVQTPIRYLIVAPSGAIQLRGPGLADAAAKEGQRASFAWQLQDFDKKPVFYRFKVATDKRFDKPLINKDLTDNQIDIDTLREGRYFWKIGVKYTPYIPIQYSEVIAFEVRRLRPGELPPPSVKPPPPPIPLVSKASTISNDVYGADDVEIVSDSESEQGEPQSPLMTEGKDVTVATANQETEPAPSSPDGALNPAVPGASPHEAAALGPLATASSPVSASTMAMPQPFAPTDRLQLQTIKNSESVTLQWSGPNNARFFIVEVATDRDFHNSQRFRTGDMLLGIQKPPGEVYWRVKALGPERVESPFSRAMAFTITKMPITLEQKEPPDGSTFKYVKRLPLIRFAWQANIERAPEADYILNVANDAALQHAVVQLELKDNFHSVDTLPAGTYFWQVGVRLAPGAPVQLSAVHKVVVVMEVTTLSPPKLLSPPFDAKIEAVGAIQPIDLSWQATDQATSYLVEIASNVAFTEPQRFTTFSTSLQTTKSQGSFYWRVKAFDANGEESPFALPLRFDIVPSARAITVSSPASDQTIGNFKVNFRWLPLAGCALYELIVSPSQTLQNPIKIEKTSALELALDFDDEDTYFWSVQCQMTAQSRIRSPIRSFKIRGAH